MARRRWRTGAARSIVVQVALAATAIAVVVGAGAAMLSFQVASERIEEVVRQQLDARASVYATQIGSDIKGLAAHLAANAENTLFANALADSAGRDRYLLPYLKSFAGIGKIPVAVVLADYLGRPVAANDGAERARIDAAVLKRVIDSGVANSTVDENDGDVLVTWIAPVFYANTGSAEGALAYQVSLGAIAADLPREPNQGGFALTVTDADGRRLEARLEGLPTPRQRLARTVAVPLAGASPAWQLLVEAWEPVDGIADARFRLALSYLAVAALTVVVVIPLSLALARSLLRRLRALEATARDVVATGAHHRRFAVEGDDEIASLGHAFNHMLAELQRAYDELKEQSARRMIEQGERFHRVLAATPTGYARIDVATACIEDVNDAFCRMIGQAPEELVGHAVPAALIHLVQAARRPGTPTSWLDELAPGDARMVRRALVNCCLDHDEAGHAQVIVFVTDITALQESEDRLREANLQLAQSVDALRLRDRELTLINRTNDLLMACQRTEDALKVVRAMGPELLPGSTGAVAVLDEASGLLETRVTWGAEASIPLHFPVAECWAMRQGRPHEVDAGGSDLVCGHVTRKLQGRSLCVPLMVQGTMLGLLWVELDLEAAGGRDNQAQIALSLSDAVKLALSNLQLRSALLEQVIRDPLTELHNRRHLDAVMPAEIARAERRQAPFCIAIIDLDHFKKVNDTYGHEGGDAVLRAFAQLLRDSLRRSDQSFRYGGEEFVLLLTDTDLAGAERCLEKLSERWRSASISHRSHAIGDLTMSIGIAEFALHGRDASSLLAAADAAVYAAKRAGRDCIRHAPVPEAWAAEGKAGRVRVVKAV